MPVMRVPVASFDHTPELKTALIGAPGPRVACWYLPSGIRRLRAMLFSELRSGAAPQFAARSMGPPNSGAETDAASVLICNSGLYPDTFPAPSVLAILYQYVVAGLTVLSSKGGAGTVPTEL